MPRGKNNLDRRLGPAGGGDSQCGLGVELRVSLLVVDILALGFIVADAERDVELVLVLALAVQALGPVHCKKQGAHSMSNKGYLCRSFIRYVML